MSPMSGSDRLACCVFLPASTYNCIDSMGGQCYSLMGRNRPCDLNGTITRTGKIFASTMFALKRPFWFSTTLTLSLNAI